MKRWALILAILALSAGTLQAAGDRDTKVRNDKKNFSGNAAWIYNDLAKAYALAQKTKRPMMVVFR